MPTPLHASTRPSTKDRFHVVRRSVVVMAAGLAGAAVLAACGSSPTPAKPNVDQLIANGLAAQRAGNVAAAQQDYQQVLTADPSNKYALYNLGLIDQLAGKSTEAEQYYRKALITDPNFTAALFNLAILRTKPNPNEAVDLYRHVIAVAPNQANAHLNLGFVLRSLGRTAEGDAEIATAVQLDPSLRGTAPTPSPQAPAPSPTPKR